MLLEVFLQHSLRQHAPHARRRVQRTSRKTNDLRVKLCDMRESALNGVTPQRHHGSGKSSCLCSRRMAFSWRMSVLMRLIVSSIRMVVASKASPEMACEARGPSVPTPPRLEGEYAPKAS